MGIRSWCMAACLAAAGVFGAGLSVQAETLLQVTGEGRIAVAPDMAVISLRVSREGVTAAGVTAQMADAARAVLAALEAEGIATRDVQTSALQLNPRWSRPSDNRAPRVVGYEAATGFEVRIRDLERFGAVLDAVIADGANGFQGVRFALSEPRPAEDEARIAAFGDAMAKARLYAEAADMAIGEIRTISEGGGLRPSPLRESIAMRAMAADVPVAGGELDVMMQVALEVVLVPIE